MPAAQQLLGLPLLPLKNAAVAAFSPHMPLQQRRTILQQQRAMPQQGQQHQQQQRQQQQGAVYIASDSEAELLGDAAGQATLLLIPASLLYLSIRLHSQNTHLLPIRPADRVLIAALPWGKVCLWGLHVLYLTDVYGADGHHH